MAHRWQLHLPAFEYRQHTLSTTHTIGVSPVPVDGRTAGRPEKYNAMGFPPAPRPANVDKHNCLPLPHLLCNCTYAILAPLAAKSCALSHSAPSFQGWLTLEHSHGCGSWQDINRFDLPTIGLSLHGRWVGLQFFDPSPLSRTEMSCSMKFNAAWHHLDCAKKRSLHIVLQILKACNSGLRVEGTSYPKFGGLYGSPPSV